MPTRKNLKRSVEFGLVKSLVIIARLLPRRIGFAVFGAVGDAAGRVFAKDRRKAAENLALAFPEMPRPFRDALAGAMFKTLGRNAYEFLTLPGATPEKIRDRVAYAEGFEHLEAASREGRGVVGITGHIGCWELLPAYLGARGLPVTAIARRMKVERLNRLLVESRAAVGVKTVDRDDKPRRMVEPLARGEVLGVLIDQHTRVAGMWVPFFGRPAFTPTAVAKLAIATGAPIVPMAIYLGPGDRHTVRVLPALRPDTGVSREENVRRLTAASSLAIEQLIRIDPKQWVWFHHRWREPGHDERVDEVAHAAQA